MPAGLGDRLHVRWHLCGDAAPLLRRLPADLLPFAEFPVRHLHRLGADRVWQILLNGILVVFNCLDIVLDWSISRLGDHLSIPHDWRDAAFQDILRLVQILRRFTLISDVHKVADNSDRIRLLYGAQRAKWRLLYLLLQQCVGFCYGPLTESWQLIRFSFHYFLLDRLIFAHISAL